MSKSSGNLGEQIAIDFLEKKAYKILHQNYRYRQYEIDIIAEKEKTLHFIEVKLRGSDNFGSPASFVSKAQQKNIAQAANNFINQLEGDPELQFDIISIFKQKNQFKIEHIEQAFRPPF